MSQSEIIVLLTPNWRWDDAPLPVDTLLPPAAPPLEWAYLAGQLPADRVVVIDAYGADLTRDQLAQTISGLRPQHVVISTAPSILYWRCPPMTLSAVTCTVQSVRQVSSPSVIIVGPHPTHSPRWSLEKSGADIAFRGAPERDLAMHLLSTKTMDCPFLESRDSSGHISVIKARDLPTAKFSAFDWSVHYEPHMWSVTSAERRLLSIRGKAALMEASRGCPWNCSYCAKGPVRDKYDRRSLASIELELAELRGLGTDYVFFVDETFNIESRYLDSLLDLIKDSGIRFGFQGRADLITMELAERLAAAGCVYAELGVDVASSEISMKVDRRQNFERAKEGIVAAKDRIPVTRFNRINLATRDYVEKLGITGGESWDYPADPAYPYPGAPLGEMLMKLYDRNEFDWAFAERYTWWLRLEVHLQRHRSDMPAAFIDKLQKDFLSLSDDAASNVARFLAPLIFDADFSMSNKYIEGEGNGIRIHRTGPQ